MKKKVFTMNCFQCIKGGILVACLLIWLKGVGYGGITADALVDPKSADNFFEARTRLWIDKTIEPKGIIVFLGGTDSDRRSFVFREEWRQIARQNSVALLGCFFRGDGEPYEDASLGSGAALVRMVEELGKKVRISGLSCVPLFFIGHSSGAMFAYNFACWMPARVGGFISVKSGPIDASKARAACSLPALFIVGECDETGRRRSILKTVAGRGISARWALAIQPSSWHEWNSSTDGFVRAYVVEMIAPKSSSDTGVVRSLFTPKVNLINRQADSMWLPNGEAAVLWERFTKAGSIEGFLHVCDVEDTSSNKSKVKLVPPIRETTKSPLTARPPSLYLGVLPRDSSVEREIDLSWPVSFGQRITEIRSSKPDFANAEVVGSASSPTRIRCKFTGKPLGNQSGMFDVVFDNSKTKRTRIIFIAWVSK